MNTFGVLPDAIRKECISQMFECAGQRGMLIIGCWHKESLRSGYQDLYNPNPQLCGPCKLEDFDFEKGNFICSSSTYTSHWWSADELKDKLFEAYPGDTKDLKIEFKVLGVGIFAICTINRA